MQNRDVIINDTQTEGSSTGGGVIAAVILIALAIALFVWQPWNTTSTQSNLQSTSVTQPANDAHANNANANAPAGGAQDSNSNPTSGGSNTTP